MVGRVLRARYPDEATAVGASENQAQIGDEGNEAPLAAVVARGADRARQFDRGNLQGAAGGGIGKTRRPLRMGSEPSVSRLDEEAVKRIVRCKLGHGRIS